MNILILKQDGSEQDEANIADAVWNVPANAAWISAQLTGAHYTFSTDPTDPDPDVTTYTNMDQIRSWIYSFTSGGMSGASAEAPQAVAAAPTASSGAGTVVAVVAGAAFVGALLYLASRR